jgi:hypothetical protein
VGVIGYNTKNLIRRVEEDVFPLQPDLLICLIGWNNLREYVYTNLRPIPKPRHTVADHFALTEQFRNMHKRLDRSFKISHRKAVSATLDSQNHRLELPFLPEFREDLLRLTQRCEIEKIPLFFVSIPHFFKTELEEKARFELLDITLGVDLSYKGWIQVLEDLNAVVQEIAGASHFISIQQAVHEPSDFSDFCHPTPQANEKMAQILQPLIRRFFP